MKQINCADGVRVTILPADKFKRCRLSINFIWNNDRSDATASALLPYLMERGYAECPDMTELSKKLSSLYGAELGVGLSSAGARRILTVSVCGIKDIFAINSEKLSEEYLKLALGVAFNPTLNNNDEFEQETINIEREKLRDTLESEINEKRSYCIRQARRRFFNNTPEGVEISGYIDEVDSLNSSKVTQAYLNMIKTSQIEVISLGVDEELVCSKMINYVKSLERNACQCEVLTAQPPVKHKCFTQEIDALQGKLCLLFTSGKVIPREEFSSVRVAVALLGSTPTSRLFVNVREKQSLCYYCAASFAYSTGVLCIDSGIDFSNASKARNAILYEIECLKSKSITEEELSLTKQYLINNLNSLGDNLAGVEGWYFVEIIRGSVKTPQQVIDEINAVSVKDIKKALSYFTLSVEYVLTQKGAENE